MRYVVAVAYVVGIGIGWYICSGIFYSEFQGKFSRSSTEDKREDLGFAIATGFVYGLLWPILLPMAWLMSGFAQYGVWKARKPSPPPSTDPELEELRKLLKL